MRSAGFSTCPATAARMCGTRFCGNATAVSPDTCGGSACCNAAGKSSRCQWPRCEIGEQADHQRTPDMRRRIGAPLCDAECIEHVIGTERVVLDARLRRCEHADPCVERVVFPPREPAQERGGFDECRLLFLVKVHQHREARSGSVAIGPSAAATVAGLPLWQRFI